MQTLSQLWYLWLVGVAAGLLVLVVGVYLAARWWPENDPAAYVTLAGATLAVASTLPLALVGLRFFLRMILGVAAYDPFS